MGSRNAPLRTPHHWSAAFRTAQLVQQRELRGAPERLAPVLTEWPSGHRTMQDVDFGRGLLLVRTFAWFDGFRRLLQFALILAFRSFTHATVSFLGALPLR